MNVGLPRAVLFCLLCSGTASAAEWGLDAGAAVNYSDNVSNALDDRDRKSDGAGSVNLAGLLHR